MRRYFDVSSIVIIFGKVSAIIPLLKSMKAKGECIKDYSKFL